MNDWINKLSFLLLTSFLLGCSEKSNSLPTTARKVRPEVFSEANAIPDDTAIDKSEERIFPPKKYDLKSKDIILQDFTQLPLEIDYNQLSPQESYEYWEYRIRFPWGIEVVGSKDGKSRGSEQLKEIFSYKGFINSCSGKPCPTYIVSQKRDLFVIWATNDSLKLFLGEINNIHEALLVARVNGFYFDKENKQAGAYRKDKNGFELLMFKEVSWCPTIYNYFQVEVNSSGKINSNDLGVYQVSSNCDIN
jgi:hypothetical protein